MILPNVLWEIDSTLRYTYYSFIYEYYTINDLIAYERTHDMITLDETNISYPDYFISQAFL